MRIKSANQKLASGLQTDYPAALSAAKPQASM